MTPSHLARVRAADAERKCRARANRSESHIDRDREQDALRARARRALMNPVEVEEIREYNRIFQSIQRNELSIEQQEQRRQENTVATAVRRSEMTAEKRQDARERNAAEQAARREVMADEVRQYVRDQDAAAHIAHRDRMTTEEHQIVRDRDTFARRATRDAMTEEDRQTIPFARRATRDAMTEEERQTIREEDAAARQATRDAMTEEERQTIRNEDAAARRARRVVMTEEERQYLRDQDAIARRATRETMTEEEQQTIRARAAAARQAIRDAMTEEDLDRRREGERFRRRSRKYQKGLRTTKSSIPLSFLAVAIIFPDTRTIPWSTNECVSTAALGNFLMKPKEVVVRLVTVRPPREGPAELNRLFGNPRFKQSIRAYNNVFAFTSMGSSRTRSLNVDERVTRSGVYNFRVQGSVCHRMGALLPPLNRRPMFAQVYINDPDMEARVASRMGMTDGLDPAILEKIDQVMTAHNGYTQQFLNARRLLIDRAGPAYQAAVE
ncbi:LOW QUALITY PROTEIN: Helitron helicase-like protein, partial [Phytophthora palmivora]